MKMIFKIKCVALLFFLSSNIYAQHQASDVSSVQNVLDAYYESISGSIGQERDFGKLRNLFHPEARLIYNYWTEEGKEINTMIMTLEEMISKLDYTVEKGFFEQEISNKVESFSTITQVFSTYKFWTEDKTIAGRGITSYEFLFDGNRYWIISMLWTPESKKFVIPEKYLSGTQ